MVTEPKQSAHLEAEITKLVHVGWLFHVTPVPNVAKIMDTCTLVCPADAASVGARPGLGSEGSRIEVVQLLDLRELEEGYRAEGCSGILPRGSDETYHLLAISPDVRELATFLSHWHVKKYLRENALGLRILPHIEVWVELRRVQAKEVRSLGIIEPLS